MSLFVLDLLWNVWEAQDCWPGTLLTVDCFAEFLALV